MLRFAEFWRDVLLLLKDCREAVEDGFLGRDPDILDMSWFGFAVLYWVKRCR